MSNDPIRSENPAIEEKIEVIEKNNNDKLMENESLDKNRLRITYDTQTVDTKIKPSLK